MNNSTLKQYRSLTILKAVIPVILFTTLFSGGIFGEDIAGYPTPIIRQMSKTCGYYFDGGSTPKNSHYILTQPSALSTAVLYGDFSPDSWLSLFQFH